MNLKWFIRKARGLLAQFGLAVADELSALHRETSVYDEVGHSLTESSKRLEKRPSGVR